MAAARNKAPKRIVGEVVSDEIIAAATRRAEEGKSRAQTAKQQRRTAPSKTTHSVHDDDVHTNDESARQADALTAIDRDSELPTSWRQPQLLDAPPPRPGYCNRWVRYRAGSDEDAEHFEEMLEEGWRPIKRKSVRKVHELTATTHGKYGQYYVKRGLILMELPEKLAIQRKRYYNKQLANMNKGVDRSMFKLQNAIMPLLAPERRTSVSRVARRGRLEDSIPGEEREEA